MTTLSPKITFVNSFEEIEKFFRWLSKDRQILAFDTETEGFSFVSDKIRLIQFGDLQEAYAIPWDRWAGVAWEVFQNYKGDFVGHNVKFDINMIEYQTGLKLPTDRIQDTMIMSRLCNWDVPSHGLKELTKYHLGKGLTKGQEALDQGMKANKWTWATVPIDFEPYWVYGGLDCVLTSGLYEKYSKKIVDEGFKDVYDMEMQMLFIASRMEQNGIRVDVKYCEEKYESMEKYCQEVREYCQKEYKVSPGSSAAIVEILLNDGIPLHKKTPGGAYAFNKDVIEEFKDAHPLVGLINEYKTAQKLGSTYFKNFLDSHVNGRIHCSINTMEARTGRSSITKPALQTAPRGRIVRDAFIAEEGEKLCAIDYSNVELRIASSLANEETMVGLFNQGQDLHNYLAAQIFGNEFTKGQRQIAKNANFGKIYGAGISTFARTAGIDEGLAKKVFDKYNETFPGMKKFSYKVMDEAKANRSRDGFSWIRIPSGRRYVVDQDFEYKLVNFQVQGIASEVLKQAVIRCSAGGLGNNLKLVVHDEGIWSFDEENFEELRDTAIDLMQDLDSYSVPLIVEASEAGYRWGDVK